jgi:hypothetical protein
MVLTRYVARESSPNRAENVDPALVHYGRHGLVRPLSPPWINRDWNEKPGLVFSRIPKIVDGRGPRRIGASFGHLTCSCSPVLLIEVVFGSKAGQPIWVRASMSPEPMVRLIKETPRGKLVEEVGLWLWGRGRHRRRLPLDRLLTRACHDTNLFKRAPLCGARTEAIDNGTINTTSASPRPQHRGWSCP